MALTGKQIFSRFLLPRKAGQLKVRLRSCFLALRLRQIKHYLVRHISGWRSFVRIAKDVEGARNLGLSSLELLNDPTKIPSFIRDIENLTTRVTPQMQQRGYAMFERQINGEDPSALYKEMIVADVGTYLPGDIEKMFTLAQRGEENVDYKRKRQSFRNAQADAGGAYDVGFSNYLQYTGLNRNELYRVDGNKEVLTEAGLQAQFNFLQEVRAKYFAKMDEADPAKFNPLEAA